MIGYRTLDINVQLVGGSLENPKQSLFLIALVAEINVTVGAVTKWFVFLKRRSGTRNNVLYWAAAILLRL